MTDEKYIYLQSEHKTDNAYPKVMTKAVVVFEGRHQVSVQSKTPCYELTNSYFYASTTGSFWSSVHDRLNECYDLSKVKQIYLLGDGAAWITAGAAELKTSETNVTYALDRFHAGQAIQRITRDKKYSSILTNYMITDMKSSFIDVVQSIKEDRPDCLIKVEDNSYYLLKHWTHIQTMYKKVKIGCAMEQVITHNIASVFSSVPKTYSRKHFETYLVHRMNHQNKLDLRKLYLTALGCTPDNDNNISISRSYDFSFFNTKNLNPTYLLHLKTFGYKQDTKF